MQKMPLHKALGYADENYPNNAWYEKIMAKYDSGRNAKYEATRTPSTRRREYDGQDAAEA